MSLFDEYLQKLYFPRWSLKLMKLGQSFYNFWGEVRPWFEQEGDEGWEKGRMKVGRKGGLRVTGRVV